MTTATWKALAMMALAGCSAAPKTYDQPPSWKGIWNNSYQPGYKNPNDLHPADAKRGQRRRGLALRRR